MFILTGSVVPATVAAVILSLNSVGLAYGTHTLPSSAVMMMGAIWLFVSLPLNLGGTILGRQWGGKADWPCRINAFPRPIPEGPWYTRRSFLIPVTGLLPLVAYLSKCGSFLPRFGTTSFITYMALHFWST